MNTMFPLFDLHTDYVLSQYEEGIKYKSAHQINNLQLENTQTKLIFSGFSYDDLFHDTDKQLRVMHRSFQSDKAWLVIKTKNDLVRLMVNKKNRGVIIHMEGADILQRDVNIFDHYYNQGLRSIGLTHTHKNCLAAGNKENPTTPLTPFGRKIVLHALKKGVIIDLAHLNKAGFYEAAGLLGKKPLFVSHTCAYKLCRNNRNLTEEQIKIIGKSHGVIGIFFSKKFVNNRKKIVEINDVVKHFIHIASIVGDDSVAIGSDFGGITSGFPKGLESLSKIGEFYKKMKEAGFNDTSMKKITHLNALRVIKHYLK